MVAVREHEELHTEMENATMKQLWLTLTLAVVFSIFSCSSVRQVQRVSLQCRTPFNGGSFIGLYSFTVGDMSECFKYPDKFPNPDKAVDLAYYFDGDDCSQGAILGQYDDPGYIFLIGHKSWSELEGLNSPSGDSESVAGIAPLTTDKEGLAFWVKAREGEYVLVRIRSVQSASYSDLVSGVTPTLEFEWARRRLSRR